MNSISLGIPGEAIAIMTLNTSKLHSGTKASTQKEKAQSLLLRLLHIYRKIELIISSFWHLPRTSQVQYR